MYPDAGDPNKLRFITYQENASLEFITISGDLVLERKHLDDLLVNLLGDRKQLPFQVL
jgi:hypothetical protein